MIITIAVYDAKRIEQRTFGIFGAHQVFIALACRPLSNTPFDAYEMNALVNFEKSFLKESAAEFIQTKESYFYNEKECQHNYTFKTDNGLSLIVLITKSKLNPVELACLKYHLLSTMHDKPGLDQEENNQRIQQMFYKIIKSPHFYTNRESIRKINTDKIKEVKRDLEETTRILKKDIEKILDRGEAIENLVVRTESLEQASRRFKDSAFEANRTCCKQAFG